MLIYQGIQLVYAHVVQMVNSIAQWFQEIPWAVWTDTLPLQFQAPVTAMVVVVLAMSCIGLVKKLSFLLG